MSNPLQPTWAASVDMPGARGTTPIGAYAHVLLQGAETNQVSILDVSDPVSPQVVGYWGAGLANPIALFHHYAYMGSSIFDVSRPDQPVAVGTFDASFAGRSHGVAGSYLYSGTLSGPLAWGVGTPGVCDMTNPLQPRRVGSFATYGNAREVTIQGSRAYVADTSGLKIFDIGNPARPVILGSDCSMMNASGVNVVGRYAYVSEWVREAERFRLHVIDVNDATCTMLGYTRDELIGMTIADLDAGGNPELSRQQMN